jgi:hypothetical protein
VKIGTLVIKKLIAYSITYSIYSLIFINIFGRVAQYYKIDPSFKLNLDFSCATQEYGTQHFMFPIIEGFTQYIAAFAAFNIYLFVGLFIAYFFHICFLIVLNHVDVEPFDWKVCFSKAMGTIAFGMSAVIYMLTSLCLVFFVYSVVKLHCLTELIGSLTALLILYGILAIIIFLIHEYCIYLFEKIRYKQKIVGMKVNKRWYEFWKPDHY